jgi:phosphoserine phosphatase RsbU/P
MEGALFLQPDFETKHRPADGLASNDAYALEQQLVRVQALLEASRSVHASLDLAAVLQEAARIAVLELELAGAWFTEPHVGYERPSLSAGSVTADSTHSDAELQLLSRDGAPLSSFRYRLQPGQQLSLYERDFLDGLVLQTALAFENAVHHQQRLHWARVERDLDAARAIQQSLLPQSLPHLQRFSIAARSRACYEVGGDYLDVVPEPDGSFLIVVADVAGKGLASALISTSFRSAFRALARQQLPLPELAERLGQQHWEEGDEARRRYVTAIFCRLDPSTATLTVVNAGHNAGLLLHDDPAQHELLGPAASARPGRSPAALHRRAYRAHLQRRGVRQRPPGRSLSRCSTHLRPHRA